MRKRLLLFISIMIMMFSGCGSTPVSNLADIAAGGGSSVDKSGATGNTASDESSVSQKEMSAFEKLFENGPMIAYDDYNSIGYIDITGNYVIQPRFTRGKKFSEGYAAVQDADNGKWGFIDATGKYVIEPQYSDVRSFFNGNAIVYIDNSSCGMIDVQRNYIIEPIYEDVSYFKEGYALVSYKSTNDGGLVYHFVDEEGNLVFGEYADAYLFENGVTLVGTGNSDYINYYYFLETTGNLEGRFYDSPVSFPSYIMYGKDYSRISRYLDLDRGQPAHFPWGLNALVNRECEVISPYFYYIDGGKSTTGLRAASIKDESTGKTLYGYLDDDYHWAIEPEYDACGFFNCDYTWAVNYSTCFYLIDKQGNKIMDSDPNNHGGIQVSVSDITTNDMLNGPIGATDTNQMKSGYVNQYYEEVIPFIYDEVSAFSSDKSYARVKYNGKWGIIDSQGNWLIEPKFSMLLYEL